MPSTISAGTTAGTALNFTSDTTGNLAFQTNGTTTALSIDTNQNVTFANNVTYTGNIQGATITATTAFSGNGAAISAINASNVSSGTLASARLPSSGINAASITTGTLAVANGGTGTATPSLVAGSGITVTGSFPNQTIAATGGGTVTSVATGNGLQGGTITTTGTLSVACPTWNTVGSYALCTFNTTGGVIAGGTNFSAGTGNNQMSGTSFYRTNTTGSLDTYNIETPGGLSGTWKNMSVGNAGINSPFLTLACRVS